MTPLELEPQPQSPTSERLDVRPERCKAPQLQPPWLSLRPMLRRFQAQPLLAQMKGQ